MQDTKMQDTEKDAVLREVAAMLETAAQRLRQLTTPQAEPRPKRLKFAFAPDGTLSIRRTDEE
jgi:hypothetical protein